jgi:hypothetical protein
MEKRMSKHTTRHEFTSADTGDLIAIFNDGPRITNTNYFRHELGRAGHCFLSGHCGSWRLLLPRRHVEDVQEFRNVKRASIEPSIAVFGHIDIVAQDGTEAHLAISIDKYLIVGKIERKSCRLLVYTETGLISNLPVEVRP